jgi:hypothetical protein
MLFVRLPWSLDVKPYIKVPFLAWQKCGSALVSLAENVPSEEL